MRDLLTDLKELGKGLLVLLLGAGAIGLGWNVAKELARAWLRP